MPPKSVLARIEQLEKKTGVQEEIPVLQGLGADGKPQFLNTFTGEILPSMPPRGFLIAVLCLDLNEI